MALNSFATQALRQTPGYVPYVPPKQPPFTIPPLSSVPVPPMPAGDFGAAGRPNATSEANQQAHLTALPSIYDPQRQQQKQNAQLALTPYGGYEFQKDDPSTPQDESLNLVATGKEGQLNRDAQRQVKGAQAARGELYSSFTDTAIGDAYTRLSESARGIVNQYAGNLASINQNQNAAASGYTDNLISMYGTDAQWLRDQPPVTPAAVPTAPPAAAAPTAAHSTAPIMTKQQWIMYHSKNSITPTGTYAQYYAAHGGK
jgi:hypothetical protein